MKEIALFSLLLLTACSMTPDYTRPATPEMAQWRAGDAISAETISPTWWQNFKSAELDGLMERALSRNNDLLAALHRIEQSRAGLKIAGASLLPSMDASSGASWSRNDPASGKTRSENSGSAGLGINYTLDLFGLNRAGVDAAAAGLDATAYDREALALTIMGDVASSYFNLLSTRDRIRIANENLANSREILRIVQARYDAGAVSALDLSQQKTVVSTSEASLSSLRQQQTEIENALSVLLGDAPHNPAPDGKGLGKITLPKIAPSPPSTLLERRPDIRSVESSLIGANANIGAARAAFFPVVNLGTDLVYALSPLSDPVSKTLALAASISAPIFSGGRLAGGVEQASARQLELAENYRKTVLTAFQEVENALSAVKTAQERERALNAALTQARRASALSRQLYEAGSVDFQSLLESQRSLLSAEDSHASARLDMLNAAVDLYLALGGGWDGKAL